MTGVYSYEQLDATDRLKDKLILHDLKTRNLCCSHNATRFLLIWCHLVIAACIQHNAEEGAHTTKYSVKRPAFPTISGNIFSSHKFSWEITPIIGHFFKHGWSTGPSIGLCSYFSRNIKETMTKVNIAETMAWKTWTPRTVSTVERVGSN